MATKRRRFTAQFKFKVALETVKGVKTLSELASEHGVHPNQIGQWKQQLIKEGAEVFSHNSKNQQNGQGWKPICTSRSEGSRWNSSG